ncbi:MAG TPA: hypothetical protein VES60_07130, partial [Nakamurella sp.]|nr:hypothetical protein [Nakamurella sp.]
MAGRATVWARGVREGHASVDVGFRLADRDKKVAAGVLAGGVAYRFFFWLLSLLVLVTGGLGFGDSQRVEDALSAAGLDPELSQAVLDSWQNTREPRWWLLVTGVWLVLWTGYLAAKAVMLVHGAVWGVSTPTGRNPLAASLAFTGAVLGFAAAVALARWLRHESPGIGLVATLSVVIIPF